MKFNTKAMKPEIVGNMNLGVAANMNLPNVMDKTGKKVHPISKQGQKNIGEVKFVESRDLTEKPVLQISVPLVARLHN